MHNLFNEKEEFLKVSPATVGGIPWAKFAKVAIKEIATAIATSVIFDGDEEK